MARVAALDFGKARIGLALSDERQMIALPRAAILTKKTLEETAAHVWRELLLLGPLQTIIIGLPLFLNGKESPMSTEVRSFAALLEKESNLPVVLRDERLTTAMGERMLKEADVGHKKRKGVIDGISATILLQNFLDSKHY
ncbi:MAG: Holliday junction resolvase RuvX [Chlamydiales bacterium]|nr:Holliday junction resolvase RuvX [Chlamydiales bacterium]